MVDSHCHASLVWTEPIELLQHQMEANDVDQAVLIQIFGITDNRYQQECVRRFPGRFVSVVGVDATRSDACDQLRRLAAQGASGVRLRATARSPEPDPSAIWRAAAALDLSVSCLGSPRDFVDSEFVRLVQELPDLRVVIEHLGASNRPENHTLEERRRTFDLARFPNVFIKIHGLGEFCPRSLPMRDPPFPPPIPPLFDMAYDAFGPDRMMWGSDFPPVASREGYRNSLRFPLEHFESHSERDRECIFGAVALRLFPLRPSAEAGTAS
jgi:L-fuconolactonase